MRVLGVIAEYNPFHLGHSYHLTKGRKECSADAVICVMSGNFVQRGEPAIADKWARAEMALEQGADLILELPVLYATRSAYWFARGGIEILYQTGVITHLSFGVETKDFEQLNQVARQLACETPEYRAELKSALKEGLSFPSARAHAFSRKFPHFDLLSQPNNILAATYLQVLYELNIPLIPVPITREGAGYHETSPITNKLPSATAIRRLLSADPAELPAEIENYMPEGARSILAREFMLGRAPIFPDSLDPQLMTLLRRSSREDLLSIIDIGDGLENRIRRTADKSNCTKIFLENLKTKRYTYTRLQRFLIHLLLNYTVDKEKHLAAGPPYLRILGFTPTGKKLLRTIKRTSRLPVITKSAHSNRMKNGNERFSVFWEMDTLATNLYSLLYPNLKNRTGNLDYFRGPVTPVPSEHVLNLP